MQRGTRSLFRARVLDPEGLERSYPRELLKADLVFEVEQQQTATSAETRIRLGMQRSDGAVADAGGHVMGGDLRQHSGQDVSRADDAALHELVDGGLQRPPEFGGQLRRDGLIGRQFGQLLTCHVDGERVQ